jgi:hypothetical protein
VGQNQTQSSEKETVQRRQRMIRVAMYHTDWPVMSTLSRQHSPFGDGTVPCDGRAHFFVQPPDDRTTANVLIKRNNNPTVSELSHPRNARREGLGRSRDSRHSQTLAT